MARRSAMAGVMLIMLVVFVMSAWESLRSTTSGTLDTKHRLGPQEYADVAAMSASGDFKEVFLVLADVTTYSRLASICASFADEPFPSFLKANLFTSDNVLYHTERAGKWKPKFGVLLDPSTRSILILIRGTKELNDWWTNLDARPKAFWFRVRDEQGNIELFFGYVHGGMEAAAYWIVDLAVPYLRKAQTDYPSYELKVVGHSLGGGTAALVTLILRETQHFQSAVCVCYGPAASMTWNLAESGGSFITTLINGADLVPTVSLALEGLVVEKVAAIGKTTNLPKDGFRFASAFGERILRKMGMASPDVLLPASVARTMENFPASVRTAVLNHPPSVAETLLRLPAGVAEKVGWEIAREGKNATVIGLEDLLSRETVGFRFYPAGKLMHIVSEERSCASDGQQSGPSAVRIFQQNRSLYGKIQLKHGMIQDHYISNYAGKLRAVLMR